MTTTQLAMSKYGNTTTSKAESSTTLGSTTNSTDSSSSSSSNYISVQHRKRMNQQAIINVIFSFSLVLLACQTFKSGIEKRRIQQQYNSKKEALQQTQTTIQQYVFPNNDNRTVNNDPSPEILQIANIILQQLEVRNHDSNNKNETTRNRNWFQNNKSSSLPIDDEVAKLFETNSSSVVLQPQQDPYPSSQSPTNITTATPERQHQIAYIIQEQLQLLLRDIAFDEYQKESLQVQALAAASTSLSSSSNTTSIAGPSHRSFHHVAKTNTEHDQDDDNMASIEQFILESLQLENNANATTTATAMERTNTTTTAIINHDTNRLVDFVETTSTPDGAENKNTAVVKKRLFSI